MAVDVVLPASVVVRRRSATTGNQRRIWQPQENKLFTQNSLTIDFKDSTVHVSGTNRLHNATRRTDISVYTTRAAPKVAVCIVKYLWLELLCVKPRKPHIF